MAVEPITAEIAWGNVINWDLRIAECETALEVAKQQKAYWVGQLAVLEAQDGA